MNIDEIIIKLLLLRGNETNEFDKETYELFEKLIIELTEIKYNIRLCSIRHCSCHTESEVRKLISNDKLKILLRS